MKELIKALNRLVKIYQIPNVDNEALVYISEWIMEEYQHHDFALIQEALKYPTKNRDNTWRLTPDTIRFWIDTTQDKVFDRKLAEESKRRQDDEIPKHTMSAKTEKMIQEYKNKLLQGISSVPEMTPEEIKELGKTRPKAFKVPSTDAGYVKDWTQRIKANAEKSYRERHPNCTEDDVQNFLCNL